MKNTNTDTMFLELKLKFSGPVPAQQKAQIMRNVLDALHHEISTRGIVPDDAEFFTEEVSLTRPMTGKTLTLDVGNNKIIEQ
jgi:hypothetical protein